MTRARAKARAAAPEISLRREVVTPAPSLASLRRWVGAALGRRAAAGEIAVLLVGRARSRALNAQYRGRDYPTNVLSFPAAAGSGALGDLVICPAVLHAEARAQRKSARSHWAHLVVHGTLHLIGYDHERDDEAQRMERREIRTLRELGFDNPYRVR